jgi:predicted outer membrane lipoprotein
MATLALVFLAYVNLPMFGVLAAFVLVLGVPLALVYGLWGALWALEQVQHGWRARWRRVPERS